MDDLNVLLRERNGYDSNALWIIKSCSYCDRGMFATRDIRAGELVFKDRPTVVGPKVSEMAPGCAVCMTGDLPLIACSKLCALPVCYGGQCENLPIHENDCKLLRQLAGDVSIDNTYWSPQLFKSLALLRCINMPQKERNIVRLLHTHKGKQTMIQINWLKNALPNGLSDEDEKWLLHCCGVLNGLAFEIPETNEESKKKRLHGLYPLAGMMNHSCSPNTERLFTTEDEVPMMSVVATVDIAKDTEITTAYCPLLWSTPTRRKFLFITKEFLCYCPRCQDSTEFGTYLAALKCPKDGGLLLPSNTLDLDSPWICNSCLMRITAKQAMAVHIAATSFNNLTQRLPILPKTNYLIIQSKLDIVLESSKDISKLTEDELLRNEEIIRETLKLLEQLHIGRTTLRGRLLMTLFTTLQELVNRNNNNNNNNDSIQTEEAKKIWAEANTILRRKSLICKDF